MKFKVGDKVRVVGNSSPTHYFKIGELVYIKGVKRDKRYEAYGYNEEHIRKIYQTIAEDDIEIVEGKDDTQVKHHAPIVYEVYEELKRHVGVENAITAIELCIVCRVGGKRELREIMREIRRSGELEKIPCSCNKGYYMASTKEEAQNAIDRLINTAKNELKTAYTMAKKLGLDGQMKIQFGKYWNDTYHSLMEEDNGEDTETH